MGPLAERTKNDSNCTARAIAQDWRGRGRVLIGLNIKNSARSLVADILHKIISRIDSLQLCLKEESHEVIIREKYK